MSGLLGRLGLRRASDDEEISATRRAWPEFDYEWGRGRWYAYPLNDTGRPVSGRTPAELRTAIREAWTAAGSPR